MNVPTGVSVGGGAGGGDTPPPAGFVCVDPVPAVTAAAIFNTADQSTTSTALSANGSSVCFTTTTTGAVRSATAIASGPNSFYYFEAKRADAVAVGVATAAASLRPNNTGGTDIIATDQALLVRDGSAESSRTATSAGNVFNVGNETTFGFAIDYRGPHPVVYVLGSTAAANATGTNVSPTYCTGSGAGSIDTATPCVYGRYVLGAVTQPLFIYAIGSTFAGGSPKVSINTGGDLAAKPFAYAPLKVRQAVRKRFFKGETGLNAQWASSAVTALPVVSASSRTRSVVKLGDSTPFTPSFTVSAAAGTTVQWLSDTGALLAATSSLSLTDTTVQTLVGTGTHRLQAVVTNSTTSKVDAIEFMVTYTTTDSDDDLDGLTYAQEQTANTDPANADTDGDGLADGVEVALNGTAAGAFNPALADTGATGIHDGRRLAGNAALAERVELRRQTGLGTGFDTSQGVVLDDSKLSIALTSALNPECTLGSLPTTFNPQPLSEEQCKKRAIRASEGIKQGEFRYYETHRLIPNENGFGPNMGQGFITPTGKIDPFCCVAEKPNQSQRDPRTPFSFMLNNAAGIWDTLVGVDQFETLGTTYVGFAVDYRGAEPVAYAITTAADGVTPVVYGPRTISGFSGDAVPFVYGHPHSDTALAMEINFGLQTFHYPVATVRALLDSTSSGSGTGAQMTPGVGIHRRP